MPKKKQGGHKRKSSAQAGNQTKKSTIDTGRSSAYDAAFEGKMIDNGFYPYGHNFDSDDEPAYPSNWNDINDILSQSRPSLSPTQFTQKDFRDFEKRNMRAATESEVMTNVFPLIAGKNMQKGKQNITFNNMKELAPDIQKEVKVDFYDGAHPTSLRKKVRDQLGEYILPSTTTTAPVAPNFFTEAKGPKGSPLVVKNQALHAGAIGARGVHKLRTFAEIDPYVDANAYTITSTYSGGSGGGVLTIYTMHPTASDDPTRSCDYHMTQLDSFAMTGNSDTFRKGATAFRNAREWAERQRNDLIKISNVICDQSNSVASTTTEGTAHTGLSQSTAAVNVDSDTSADELSADVIDNVIKRPAR